MMTPEEIKTILKESLTAARTEIEPEGFTRAAVLVPLFADKEEIHLLFTKRTDSVETHKGQISFPGGMVDRDDTDIIHTALREVEEEIGIPGSSVQIVGLLDDLRTPTGFVITPVVGIIPPLPELTPNLDEVAEIFYVPLMFFADPSNGRTEIRQVGGKSHEVWFFDYGGHTIWGATAWIIRSLLGKLNYTQTSQGGHHVQPDGAPL